MPLILSVILMVLVMTLLLLIKKYLQDLILHFKLALRAASTSCHLCSVTEHHLSAPQYFFWTFTSTTKEIGADAGKGQCYLWTIRTALANRQTIGKTDQNKTQNMQDKNYDNSSVLQLRLLDISIVCKLNLLLSCSLSIMSHYS